MNSIIRGIYAIITFVIISTTNIFAQDSTSVITKHGNWINLGVGASNAGLGLCASISNSSNNNLFSTRFAYNNEFNILGPEPAETIWDFGILYGIIQKDPHSMASISAGVSLVGGVNRGDFIMSTGWFESEYEKKNFFTIGLPVETQLFWRPTNNFGIGFYGFANFNPKKTFAGCALSLQLGSFKHDSH